MEKYYQPSLEEFRLGFEYEVKKSDGIWVKETCSEYTDRDYGNTLIWTPYELEVKKEDVRVKLLDKGDILECGFKFKQEFREREVFDEYTFANGILQHWFKTNSIVIHSDGYNRVGSFIGTIRNKSEFSVLLRQLGINR